MTDLVCEGIVAGYGSNVIVDSLDIDVESGNITALLGPNGAGKSTLMLSLAGLLPRSAGTVHVGDIRLPSGNARAASRAGLVLVPDDRALFASLTVIENIEVARRKRARSVSDVLDIFPALRGLARSRAASLSGGEAQMLALARAFAQAPAVLMIDEMSLGLAPVIVRQLMGLLREIATQSGTSVLLVEQHISIALELADMAYVMSRGSIALRGTANALSEDMAAVELAYLGDAPG
jgi:branched-chain amino acid transport system ATP-binding protein